jgi:hypothetical protein
MTTSLAHAHEVAVRAALSVTSTPGERHRRCSDPDCDVRWYGTETTCWACGRENGWDSERLVVAGTSHPSQVTGVLTL